MGNVLGRKDQSNREVSRVQSMTQQCSQSQVLESIERELTGLERQRQNTLSSQSRCVGYLIIACLLVYLAVALVG